MPGRSAHRDGPAVRLRAVVPADLPAIYRFQLDPESNAMAVANPRDLDGFTEHWTAILGDPGTVARAVLADSVLVGSISCFTMDSLDCVGYWIAREHWGRGIATRALALLLGEVRVRPLHARVATSNIGSIRVLERCGFAAIGTRLSPGDDRFPACEEVLMALA